MWGISLASSLAIIRNGPCPVRSQERKNMRPQPVLFGLTLLLGWLASGASAQEDLTSAYVRFSKPKGSRMAAGGFWWSIVIVGKWFTSRPRTSYFVRLP